MNFVTEFIVFFFKKHHTRKNLILYFLLICHASLAQNTLHTQYAFAKKLFNDENFFEAITEYKRLIFFDSLNQYSFKANKHIALCYKHGGKFSEAIYYFTLAELSAPNLDSLFDIKIEIVKTNLLRSTIYHAFELLNDLNNEERFADKKDQITYWKGWAYIFNDDWESASKEFAKLNVNHEMKLLCDNACESEYSTTKAKILSYIIPGAGQFYTGNYLSGILSFGWVALWTYISVNAFMAERVFDGIIVADFLAFRFYNGSLQNAEKFAIEHNSEVSDWMLKYLENNYRGLKP